MSKRRASGDGTLRKREDGRWEGRLIIGTKKNGQPLFKCFLHKSQKEVLARMDEYKENLKGAVLCEDYRMTLGEWLDKWLGEHMAFTIRESTWKAYETEVRLHIKPYLGDKQIAFVTTADVQRMYNKLKKSGRSEAHPIHGHKLSDSYVRKIHMMLHEAMDTAVKERLIVKNPTNGTTIPKTNYPPKQILTDAQLEKFIAVVMQDELWRDFFYTELTTGLRRGEICGLRWSDFNAETGHLKVSRTVLVKMGGGLTWGDTKTETGMRTILLPPSTAEMLRERKKISYSEWIFPNLYKPEQPLYPGSAYNRMKVLLKRAELPLIRFHDLRHTYATHALTGGVDAKTHSVCKDAGAQVLVAGSAYFKAEDRSAFVRMIQSN